MTVIEVRKRAKGAGRKPAANPRERRINIMLTHEEYERWMLASFGQPLTPWIRDIINAFINRATGTTATGDAK